jgi:hypothetical protein
MKFQKEIQLNSKSRNFFEFSFEIHFESKEVHRKKIVPLIKTFKTNILFQIFRAWEGPAWIDQSLNRFEICLKSV